MGVISPNTRMNRVSRPTAIPGPTLPNSLVAMTVAKAEAAILTRLLPINMVLSICEGSFLSLYKAA